MLVAKGISIAGILPLALDLGTKRHYDNGIRDKIQLLRNKMQGQKATADSRGSQQEDTAKLSNLQQMKLFRDSTKKVILFWSLERNSNMDWVQKELEQLQALDTQNVSCGLQNLGANADKF